MTHPAVSKLTKPVQTFLFNLYQQADDIVKNDYYRKLKDEDYFYTKLVGVTFEGRQERINKIQEGENLVIKRDPDNLYDPNAISVLDIRGNDLGFLNRDMAAHLAPAIDRGQEYNIVASQVTGKDRDTQGLNVYLERKDYVEEQEIQQGMEVRKKLMRLGHHDLLDNLRQYLIGDYPFREKQKETLDRLFKGKKTLTIMGTGRGKSAIFQVYASYLAIKMGLKTVIIYPLRALANDQYEGLRKKLAPVGMRVLKANGSISDFERDKLFQALRNDEADIILTTPEFLDYYCHMFRKVGFFVADEAHHIGMDSYAFRPVYKQFSSLVERLRNPEVLAVTATADDEVAGVIINSLDITDLVYDPTVRENLRIKDLRDAFKNPRTQAGEYEPGDKEAYIAKQISQGGKTIVYTTSREKSIRVAEYLRNSVPDLMDQIAFYNGGMSRVERTQVEDYFREGDLQVVVATKAFGEGIDIPDIRHVIHYQMPFNFVEFNQMSGRGGRDGEIATIHLIFGKDDAGVNQFILENSTPDRDYLALIYKYITKAGGEIEYPNDYINDEIQAYLDKCPHPDMRTSPERVAASIGILEELELIEIEREGRDRTVRLLPNNGKGIQLHKSSRYAEGVKEIAVFERFSTAVMKSKAESLLRLINRPIIPKGLIDQQASA